MNSHSTLIDRESEPFNKVRRLLVVIASFGEKNLPYLRKIIAKYRAMPMEVDIVIVSEAPKQLGNEVEVIVGLPTKNPWSLPFAHKRILAERVDRYDLFIYSEDDTDINEKHITAFLNLTPLLDPAEIAGFLRYEEDLFGNKSFPEIHGGFHWKPDSVRKRGAFTVAEFTNEHAAFYLLTQSQLKRAIASGGFLRAPYEGRYDMACTAATDPYTICGFKKVICISHLDEFLIHHMPNRYVGQLGLSVASLNKQIAALMRIADGDHPASTLFHLESKILHGAWSKSYYEKPDPEFLKFIPPGAKMVLSVGCGDGTLEDHLINNGFKVVALPLDSVIVSIAQNPKLAIIYGSFSECLRKLEGQTFDCVIVPNFLHLIPDPETILDRCADRLRSGGALLLTGPNFEHFKVLIKRFLRKGDYDLLGSFAKSGINVFSPSELGTKLKSSNLRVKNLCWYTAGQRNSSARKYRFTSRQWVTLLQKVKAV
jgi:2-polyprenyl-3-methyl-5-hydroxy-6-metoxy-1,4-benzoquinol methylase